MANSLQITTDEAHSMAAQQVFLRNSDLMLRWNVPRSTFFMMKAQGKLPPTLQTPFGPRFRLADIEAAEASWPEQHGT